MKCELLKEKKKQWLKLETENIEGPMFKVVF
jgi:hypothetical protein